MSIGIGLVPGQHRHLNIASSLWPPEDILLVELPDAAVQKLLETGACFKSRGGPSDPLVFCTDNETFTCKHVETTNSLLLCDISEESGKSDARALATIDNITTSAPCTGLMTQVEADMKALHESSVDVLGISNFTVEATKRDPPEAQLYTMLSLHQYGADNLDEDEMEVCHSGSGITWPELQDTILASDCQIVHALQILQAFGVPYQGGYRWSSMSDGYLSCIVEVLMMTCIEHGLCLSSFDPHTLIGHLADSPDDLSQELLSNRAAPAWYGIRTFCTLSGEAIPTCTALSDSGAPDTILSSQQTGVLLPEPVPAPVPKGNTVSFDYTKCARQYARSQLKKAGGNRVLSEFLGAWRDSVPAIRHWTPPDETPTQTAELNEDMLAGLVLIDKTNKALHTIAPLIADELPRSVSARFKVLFSSRTYWTSPDIAPYLEGVYDNGKTGVALLLTHARMSRGQGDELPVYSAR